MPTKGPPGQEGPPGKFARWGSAGKARRWWSSFTKFLVSWSASHFIPGSFLSTASTHLPRADHREGQGHGLHGAHKDNPNVASTSRKSAGSMGFCILAPLVLE